MNVSLHIPVNQYPEQFETVSESRLVTCYIDSPPNFLLKVKRDGASNRTAKSSGLLKYGRLAEAGRAPYAALALR
jgi:hypothetical protein